MTKLERAIELLQACPNFFDWRECFDGCTEIYEEIQEFISECDKGV